MVRDAVQGGHVISGHMKGTPFHKDVPVEDQPAVLREFLEYRDGHIYSKVAYSKVAAGARLGAHDHHKGYFRFRVFGRHTGVHRIIWALVYGQWPPDQIDHINHDPADNRIENLRLATNAENETHRKPRTGTRSGLPGAYPIGNGRYQAIIGVNKKLKHLGCFGSAEEAHAAYAEAKRKYHPFAATYQTTEAA